MNARYYNGTIGRFISQDPLAIESLQTEDNKKFQYLLANPQNWNTYSYALNNPLVAVDPSGLLTIYVPGTYHNFNDVAKSHLGQSLQNTFNEKPYILSWSGNDNRWARTEAANKLAEAINNYKFAEGEKLNIIAHSHGGNIAFEASQKIEHAIDNLVTLAMPVRNDYQPNIAMIKNNLNLYSNYDAIQVFGGGQMSVTELLGNAFGERGKKIGEFIGFGEFGRAGFWVNSAKNIDVSRDTVGTMWGSHTKTWTKPQVWDKYVQPNIKK
jgi:RHS repeat-associated protein